MTKGRLTPLWILYQELVIKKGMSYEKVANTFNIALNRLPYMEILYEHDDVKTANANFDISKETMEKVTSGQ